MARESKLVKRGDIYYLRKRVPSDLVGIILGPSGKPRREIWKSLKVNSYNDAKRKLPIALANLEQEFSELRSSMKIQLVDFKKLIPKERTDIENIVSLLEKLSRQNTQFYSPPPNIHAHSIEELTKSFLGDKEKAGKRASTMLSYNQASELMNGFFGTSKKLHELSMDDMRAFCDFLDLVPVNAKQRFPNMSITQAVLEAEKRNDVKLLSIKSKALLLNKVSSVFAYAVLLEWLDKNPASHPILKGRYRPTRTKKALFTVSQLNQIFTGAWFLDVSHEERDGLFWIPLIGLFHGCRLNEICQLNVEHIVTSESVPYFLIQEGDDVHLKTSASNRAIPIHKELLKMGFLELVEARKANRSKIGKLFPELKLASDNTYSSHFSKRFIRYKDKTLSDSSKATFHSFRHMFRDALRRANVSTERVNALGGWAGSGGMEAHYGDGLLVEELNDDLQSVRYAGLILDHLYI